MYIYKFRQTTISWWSFRRCSVGVEAKQGYHDDKNGDDGEDDLVIMIMIQVMVTIMIQVMIMMMMMMMMMMMTMHQIPFAGRSNCHTHTNTVPLSLMRQHAFEMAGWKLFCSIHKNVVYIYIYMGPQTTIYKWLFQLYDSKSVHRTWLFHQNIHL